MNKDVNCYNCTHLNMVNEGCNNNCECLVENNIMKRYRVESRSGANHFIADCGEEDLEYWKALCKYDAIKNNGKCYYREFPVTKNKKIYYAKDNALMTKEEIAIIEQRISLN